MVVVYEEVVNFVRSMTESRSMSGILIMRTGLPPWVRNL